MTATNMSDILIVDDDENILPVLSKFISKKDFTVRTCRTLSQAKQSLAEKLPDGVLVDLVLPDGSGLDLVDVLKSEATQIIIMTGHPSLDSAIAGVRGNAIDYLVKPIELERLNLWLSGLNTSKIQIERIENSSQQAVEPQIPGMIGTSIAIKRVQKMIGKVAPTEVTVLLQGESGTGKEVAAKAIHLLSSRSCKPFLALNCGATHENLISDELFGHERGGFTGANKQHKGFFERADGGTLFLDEVTEMPIELQPHLLRVLETGKFIRIGGDTEVATDVRVVAATNRDPREAIAEGKLREDLYYRLAIFPIKLPPLRARNEDIEVLALHFMSQLNGEEGLEKTIQPEAIAYLKTLSWPGNIRQFKNAMQRAYLLADHEIETEHFEVFEIETADFIDFKSVTQNSTSIDQAERQLILASLEEHNGNKKLAAEMLGISLKTLYNKLKRYQQDDINYPT